MTHDVDKNESMVTQAAADPIPGSSLPVTLRNKGSVIDFTMRSLETIGRPLVSILAAFVVAGILIAIIHINPFSAFYQFFEGSLGSKNGIAETLVRATPLALAALGVAVAFRAGVWNIGAEGQIFMGALGATLAGLYLPPMPLVLHLPLVLLGGFAGGALWGMVAGIFKARFNANEIIVTIMMNYIAIFIVSFLVTGPMKDASGMIPQPQTVELPASALLPVIISGTRAHAGTIVLIGVVAIVWFLMNRTSTGYELRSAGANPDAARHIGINVLNTVVIAMAISGGLAGLAGANEVSGVQHLLTQDISSNYGYLCIAVALLGGLDPLGVLLSAIFFGVVYVGSESMERAMNVPVEMVYIIQGLVIVAMLLRQLGQRRKG
jgi:general nucleoside transport system permease protein